MLVATELPILTGEQLLVSFRAPRSTRWFDQPATIHARVVHGRRPGERGRRLGLHSEEIGAVEQGSSFTSSATFPPTAGLAPGRTTTRRRSARCRFA